MERQPVASSLIRSVGYDPAGSILEVEFVEPSRRLHVLRRAVLGLRRAAGGPVEGAVLQRLHPGTLRLRGDLRRAGAPPASWTTSTPRMSRSEAGRPTRLRPGVTHRARGSHDRLVEGLRRGDALRDVPGRIRHARRSGPGGTRCTGGSRCRPSSRPSSAASSGGCRCSAWPGRGAATASTSARSSIISREPRTLIDLRFLDRDARPDVRDALSINGGHRVPVVVFLSEDGFEVSRYGERTLSTYRRMAAEQLGPACPTGFVPPADEALAAVTAEWLAEFERAQLILRLSPRLRAMHGD